MVYLDFRSLCLIIAMRRSGRGSGRHLVSYSLRFTLTEPHRRHAAWRHSRRGRGEGAQVGGGQVGRGGEVGRPPQTGVKGVYFKF